MALFGARAHGKRRKQVERELEDNPVWGVIAQQKWVCPYCGKLAVRLPDDPEDRVDPVLDHLDGACPDYLGGEGAERPLIELRRVATRRELRTLVKQQLVKSKSWQLMDYSQRWYCAYCGDVTQVTIPKDRKMTEPTLQEIIGHVETCYAYDKGRGREKPFAHLKSIVRHQNQSRKLAENVRTKLEGDPVWRRKDPRNRWICPYCLGAQDHIDLSSNLLMFENAPALIAKHLAAACDEFRKGGEPQPLGKQQSDLIHDSTLDSEVLDGDVFANSERLGDIRPPDSQMGLGRSTGRLPKLVSETGPLPIGSDRWEGSVESKSERYSRTLWGKDGVQAKNRQPGQERGTTLRQLEESGEYLLVDDELNDFRRGSGTIKAPPTTPATTTPAPAPTPPSDDSSRARSVSSWRREIEQELASVRSMPTAFERSGEHSLAGSRRGDRGEDDDLADKLQLNAKGLELRRLRVLPKTPRGDFVEALPLGENRLAIFAGGVAGEESEAPLIAAMAKNLIKQAASPNRCPADVLRRVNADIFSDLDGRSFVAVTYALVDLASCRARLARAGLAAPVLFNPNGPLRPLDSEGMVMGIDSGPIFNSSLQVKQVALEPGDLLVMFTGGVIEARSPQREEFGVERTHQLIERYGTHELAYFVDKFKEYFGLHVRGRTRTDACVIALKRSQGAA